MCTQRLATRVSTVAAVLCVAGLIQQAYALGFGCFNESSVSGITSNNYSTAAFGDYNNDGFIDLAVTTCAAWWVCQFGDIYLYRNNPLEPGKFTRIDLLLNTGPARQVAWADFDNDGDLDLYANGGDVGGHQYLFQNLGAAGNYELQLITGGGSGHSDNVLPNNQNVQGAGWLDANQDGWLDLFISNGNGGSSKLYLNNGINSQTNQNWFDPGNAANWFVKFEETAWAVGATSRNGSYSTFGDFDNDGRQDIFYAVDEDQPAPTTDGYRVFVWRNVTAKGSTTFAFNEMGKTVLNSPLAPLQEYRISWTGILTWDADNDGDLDLLVGWSNYLNPGKMVRPQFYRNSAGFSTAGNLAGIFQENTTLPFTLNATYTGGVAAADVNNDGLLDCYIAHSTTEDHKLYINNGGLSFTTVSTGISHAQWASGVTFGDIDNDGDVDLFVCNGGRLFLNQTNSKNLPAHPKNTPNAEPSGSGRQEHYLDVLVSGSNEGGMGFGELKKTKDGIGARVYLFRMTDVNDMNPSNYNGSNLIGMREIDGGSGYGCQATQVQHFGLPTTWSPNPHLDNYAVRIVFNTGEELWKWRIVPDKQEAKIQHAGGTTWLAQTLDASRVEKAKRKLR